MGRGAKTRTTECESVIQRQACTRCSGAIRARARDLLLQAHRQTPEDLLVLMTIASASRFLKDRDGELRGDRSPRSCATLIICPGFWRAATGWRRTRTASRLRPRFVTRCASRRPSRNGRIFCASNCGTRVRSFKDIRVTTNGICSSSSTH
jgi:hypothetical protein